jgi:hypothetical protein
MCAQKRKNWVEKRQSGKTPQLKKLEMDYADMQRGDKMLITTPEVVDEFVRHIPKGQESTLLQLRKDMAAEYGGANSCPLVTGICLRIVSEAAYEEYDKGKAVSQITPFWRIVNQKSSTAKKLSFGTDFLSEQRKKEGLKP